ncbi:drebrin-like isoform X2 [Acipenser ruthenus]|uniref:drebrin-like isoform X2 n=1 Tax=Acipenser ruthenus TaxID=7906 RepID=UPI002740A46B|nr:drebrin-like isoform X2 [Acipenser ruthenus]
MAVNLSKNRLNLLTAYQDVIDEKSSTNWALYTYEDSTDDLTLASSGDGGLPEITVSFDNTRVMYGFCSMKEPNAALPRYILINWVGEDVPDARKCACASHVSMIAEFFQVSLTEGVDVIINASSMEDIDPAAIGQRLTNGTAVIASPVLSRLRIREEEQTQPVGTCYEKTNAEIEMKKINREEFWEQAKRDEEMRKEEERRKALEERQRFEEERMELERREQEEREKRYHEREMQIEEHRRQQQSKEVEDVQERTKDQSIFVRESCLSVEQEEEASQQLKKMESEVEEAAAIIAQRTDNPREYFKQRERAVAISFDSSPLSSHRAGRLESPFLKLHHSLPEPSSSPPCSPLLSPALPLTQLQPSLPDDLISASPDRSPTPLLTTPIPRIVTTPIFEETEDDTQPDSHSDWAAPPPPEPALPPCVDSSWDKPEQSVAPQMHEEEPLISDFREMPPIPEPVPPPQDPTASLLDLWDSPAPQCASEQLPLLVEAPPQDSSSSVAPLPLHSEPPAAEGTLLSFDDLPEPPATFCEAEEGGDNPPSLVDISGQHQMTLGYQRALQEASGSDSQDKEELLMTNGETLQKEGTQASEGYFSQSQEEEFAQSDECSAKVAPGPIFYNKPPEIDITCWDTDPVTEEDEYGAEE